MYRKYLKRTLDIILALAILFLFWWIFIAVAFIVKNRLGSPVIFRQKRPGKNGKLFTLFKFRTMKNSLDCYGNLLSNEERLTEFSLTLRSSSLDELPQIWNVLKGDMSFIGPRPLLGRYLSRYSPTQFRRHEIRPGITGWAQVNGRELISWEERFKFDIEYVDNYNFFMDMKILLLTVRKIIFREGVSPEKKEITDDFMGDNYKDE